MNLELKHSKNMVVWAQSLQMYSSMHLPLNCDSVCWHIKQRQVTNEGILHHMVGFFHN